MLQELLNKTTVIFSDTANKNTVITKEERDEIYLSKKHIIKNLFNLSPLFHNTIENFDKVEQYYFIISFYHRDYGRPKSVVFRLSIYLDNYKYLRELMSLFGKEEPQSQSFKINQNEYFVNGSSINIEWFNMKEEEKLDAYYTLIEDRENTDINFSMAFKNYGNTFNIVFKNYESTIINPNQRKKVNIPLNTNNKTNLFAHFRKSFIRNDEEFYDKYKLILEN